MMYQIVKSINLRLHTLLPQLIETVEKNDRESVHFQRAYAWMAVHSSWHTKVGIRNKAEHFAKHKFASFYISTNIQSVTSTS